MYIPSIKELRNDIMFAFQRAFRGYDDRVKWGFGLEYYLEIIFPSLKEFCEYEIETDGGRNPIRVKVFKKTIELINDHKDNYSLDNEYKVFEYIGKHIGHYWN